jgi:hypothetical protein
VFLKKPLTDYHKSNLSTPALGGFVGLLAGYNFGCLKII